MFLCYKNGTLHPAGGVVSVHLALSSGLGSRRSVNLWGHPQTMPTLRGLDAVNDLVESDQPARLDAAKEFSLDETNPTRFRCAPTFRVLDAEEGFALP